MPAIDELRAAARSIVQVENDEGTGSGSVIAHKGSNSYILTCEHVVGAAGTRVKVTRREGKRFVRTPGVVERVDTKNDLAIVRTARRLPVPEIDICEDEPEQYEPLYAIGCGSGFYGIASPAILVARDGSAGPAGGDGYVYTGLAIGGMSGGALVDADGALVGVIHAMDRNGHLPVWSIGHAVPLPVLRRFLTPVKFANRRKSA